MLGPEVGRLLAERYREHGVDLRSERGRASRRQPGGGPRGSPLRREPSPLRRRARRGRGGASRRPRRRRRDPYGRVRSDGAARVHACGDVAASWRPSLGQHVRREHWTSAAGQGARSRAPSWTSQSPRRAPYFWSDQFGLRLQHVGHRTAGRGSSWTASRNRSRPAMTAQTAAWWPRFWATARRTSGPRAESSRSCGPPRETHAAAVSAPRTRPRAGSGPRPSTRAWSSTCHPGRIGTKSKLPAAVDTSVRTGPLPFSTNQATWS